MLTEITKLEAVRAVGLPTTLFTDISPKVVAAWRARAAVESPSHLRRHAQPVRLVLLAALLYQRQREITDTLVELLNSCVHKINAHAEKKVTEEFVRQYKRIRNKDAMLQRVAEVSLESPAEPVRDVIYPVMGGEAGLTELVREYRARRAYERDKRRVFKSSYTNHYRTGLIKLLQVLEFRSNNTEHQPVLDGLKLILRYAEAKTTFYPRGETVVLDGVLKEDWREFAVSADHRGRATGRAPCLRMLRPDRAAGPAALQRDLGRGRGQVAQPRRRPPSRLRRQADRALRTAEPAAGRQGVHRRHPRTDARRAGPAQHRPSHVALVVDRHPQPRRDQADGAGQGAANPATCAG